MPFADPTDRTDYYRRVEKHRNGGHLPTVLAHVRLLRESGMSLPRVCELSGVSYLSMRGLWNATSSRVTRSVAERVLAVRPGDLSDAALVDRHRADMLVDELTSRGWTERTIGDAFGYDGPCGFRVQRPKVRMGTVRRLEALLAVDPPGTTVEQVIEDKARDEARRDQQLRRKQQWRQEQGENVAALTDTYDPALWRERSACRDRNLTSVFLSSEKHDKERARRICRGCDVRAECLEWVLGERTVDDFYGICAGTDEDERVELRRQRRKASA